MGPPSQCLQELIIARGQELLHKLGFPFLNTSWYCSHAVSALPLCIGYGGGGIQIVFSLYVTKAREATSELKGGPHILSSELGTTT